MKKVTFNPKAEPKSQVSGKYDFSEESRNKYINEISESIKEDVRLNEIKEAESIECASRFITT